MQRHYIKNRRRREGKKRADKCRFFKRIDDRKPLEVSGTIKHAVGMPPGSYQRRDVRCHGGGGGGAESAVVERSVPTKPL